eukprot:TRINITY_DN1845_c0_g2_i1.p1 TRINITY_DN1845_c0_g2~~TRINITY_DN1845_c0_g2_i1.p1  ORF type:complete len:669 (-),score=132.61 TRINITY_DN1845_c0_g2_i1:56-2062(-)
MEAPRPKPRGNRKKKKKKQQQEPSIEQVDDTIVHDNKDEVLEVGDKAQGSLSSPIETEGVDKTGDTTVEADGTSGAPIEDPASNEGEEDAKDDTPEPTAPAVDASTSNTPETASEEQQVSDTQPSQPTAVEPANAEGIADVTGSAKAVQASEDGGESKEEEEYDDNDSATALELDSTNNPTPSTTITPTPTATTTTTAAAAVDDTSNADVATRDDGNAAPHTVAADSTTTVSSAQARDSLLFHPEQASSGAATTAVVNAPDISPEDGASVQVADGQATGVTSVPVTAAAAPTTPTQHHPSFSIMSQTTTVSQDESEVVLEPVGPPVASVYNLAGLRHDFADLEQAMAQPVQASHISSASGAVVADNALSEQVSAATAPTQTIEPTAPPATPNTAAQLAAQEEEGTLLTPAPDLETLSGRHERALSDTLPPSPIHSVEHPMVPSAPVQTLADQGQSAQSQAAAELAAATAAAAVAAVQEIVVPTYAELPPLQIRLSRPIPPGIDVFGVTVPRGLSDSAAEDTTSQVHGQLAAAVASRYRPQGPHGAISSDWVLGGGGGGGDGDSGDSHFLMLLYRFRDSLLSLAATQQSIQAIHDQSDQVYQSIWTQDTITLKGQANCGDGERIEGSMRFERMEFNQDYADKLGEILSTLRDEEFNGHTLATYRVTLAA